MVAVQGVAQLRRRRGGGQRRKPAVPLPRLSTSNHHTPTDRGCRRRRQRGRERYRKEGRGLTGTGRCSISDLRRNHCRRPLLFRRFVPRVPTVTSPVPAPRLGVRRVCVCRFQAMLSSRERLITMERKKESCGVLVPASFRFNSNFPPLPPLVSWI